MRKTIATIAAITLSYAPVSPVDASNQPVRTQTATPGRCPKLESAIKRHGLPVKHFSFILWRESKCNPKAVSAVRSTGYSDLGAAQIQGSWRTVTYRVCKLKPTQSHIKALLKLDCNLKVAKYLYDHGGYGHWKGTSGQS